MEERRRCVDIEVEERAPATIVTIHGRLDASSSAEFERRLDVVLQAGDAILVLDFSKTAYVSSAGLRVLLAAARKLGGAGRQLLLCGLNPDVMEVFRVTGLHRVLNIHPDLEQTLATLA